MIFISRMNERIHWESSKAIPVFLKKSQVYYAHCICQCVVLADKLISLLPYIRRSLCSLLLLFFVARGKLGRGGEEVHMGST
jgi:hypothetical protein